MNASPIRIYTSRDKIFARAFRQVQLEIILKCFSITHLFYDVLICTCFHLC